MLLWKEQTAKQNSEANIQGQIASAQEAEKSKQETESVKGDFTLQKVKMEGETMNKNAVVAMVTSIISKGGVVPAELQPLVQATVENIMLPLISENEEQRQLIMQKMNEQRDGIDDKEQIVENTENNTPSIIAA